MSYEFDTDTLDLADAEVVEDVTYNKHNTRYITVQFDSCSKTSYIIGQFKSGGFRVFNIYFEQNKARFIKEI
ncbi:hypothetical protein 7908G4F8_4 [Haloquadratum phage sp.]|nr:hypothetical protein 7908G4F8_4 [Haloquadratum phage sp.]